MRQLNGELDDCLQEQAANGQADRRVAGPHEKQLRLDIRGYGDHAYQLKQQIREVLAAGAGAGAGAPSHQSGRHSSEKSGLGTGVVAKIQAKKMPEFDSRTADPLHIWEFLEELKRAASANGWWTTETLRLHAFQEGLDTDGTSWYQRWKLLTESRGGDTGWNSLMQAFIENTEMRFGSRASTLNLFHQLKMGSRDSYHSFMHRTTFLGEINEIPNRAVLERFIDGLSDDDQCELLYRHDLNTEEAREDPTTLDTICQWLTRLASKRPGNRRGGDDRRRSGREERPRRGADRDRGHGLIGHIGRGLDGDDRRQSAPPPAREPPRSTSPKRPRDSAFEDDRDARDREEEQRRRARDGPARQSNRTPSRAGDGAGAGSNARDSNRSRSTSGAADPLRRDSKGREVRRWRVGCFICGASAHVKDDCSLLSRANSGNLYCIICKWNDKPARGDHEYGACRWILHDYKERRAQMEAAKKGMKDF
jgi:hypothetical protein